jgi:putative transposase
MSMPDRRAMIDPAKSDLSVRRQCELLALARSGVYRPKSATATNDLAQMRRIDELHLKLPFYGSRRMMFELNKESPKVNRKHVQRLMRLMGIVALVPRPGTSKPAPGHKIDALVEHGEVRERRRQLRHPAYQKPELLATGPNQVWSWDISVPQQAA